MAYYKFVDIESFRAIVPNATASGIVFSTTNNEVAGVSFRVDSPAYINFDDRITVSSGYYMDASTNKTLTTPEDGLRIAKISIFAPSGQVRVDGYAWA